METRWFKEISQFNLVCSDRDHVWFVGDNYSVIFEMDLKDNQILRMVRIKGEEFQVFRKYWRLEKAGNKLVLIPHHSDQLVIYHTDKNEFSFIQLEKAFINCLSCVKVGKILYLISDLEIVAADIENEKIEEYIPVPQYGKTTGEVAILVEGHIIIPLVFQPGIIDFCITERIFCYYPLEGGVNGFVAGAADGWDIWLAGDTGSIVKWNYQTKKSVFYDIPPKGFMTFNYNEKGEFVSWKSGWVQGISFQYWYECVLLDDKVWFIPQYSDSLLYMDKKSNSIKKYTFENERETEWTMKEHRSVKFLLMGVYKKRYIKIYSTKRNVIYKIDAVRLKHTEESIDIAAADKGDVENEYWNHLYKIVANNVIVEKNNISLMDLTALIKNADSDVLKNDKRIGICIHSSL